MSPTPTYTQPETQRSGLLTALVVAAIIVLVAANIYLYVQIDHVRTDMAKVKDSLSTEISNLRDQSSVVTNSQVRRMETLKEELAAAQAAQRNASSSGLILPSRATTRS